MRRCQKERRSPLRGERRLEDVDPEPGAAPPAATSPPQSLLTIKASSSPSSKSPSLHTPGLLLQILQNSDKRKSLPVLHNIPLETIHKWLREKLENFWRCFLFACCCCFRCWTAGQWKRTQTEHWQGMFSSQAFLPHSPPTLVFLENIEICLAFFGLAWLECNSYLSLKCFDGAQMSLMVSFQS